MPHERSFQPRALAAPRWFTPHVDRRFVAPCSRSWGSPRFRLSVPEPRLSPPASRPPRLLALLWNPGTSPPSPRCSYPPKNSPRCPPYRVSAALPSVPFTLPRWLRSPIARLPLPFPLRRSAEDHIAAVHLAVFATSRRLRGPSGLVLYRTRSPPFAARAADDGPGSLRSFQPPNLAAARGRPTRSGLTPSRALRVRLRGLPRSSSPLCVGAVASRRTPCPFHGLYPSNHELPLHAAPGEAAFAARRSQVALSAGSRALVRRFEPT